MMYEVSFATLSERFFKGTSWPHVDYIADLVDNDHVFCLLYKASQISGKEPRRLITECCSRCLVYLHA